MRKVVYLDDYIVLCTLHEDIRPCDAIYTLNFAFPPPELNLQLNRTGSARSEGYNG